MNACTSTPFKLYMLKFCTFSVNFKSVTAPSTGPCTAVQYFDPGPYPSEWSCTLTTGTHKHHGLIIFLVKHKLVMSTHIYPYSLFFPVMGQPSSLPPGVQPVTPLQYHQTPQGGSTSGCQTLQDPQVLQVFCTALWWLTQQTFKCWLVELMSINI